VVLEAERRFSGWARPFVILPQTKGGPVTREPGKSQIPVRRKSREIVANAGRAN
jgi:hypothetical protein